MPLREPAVVCGNKQCHRSISKRCCYLLF